MKKFNYIYLITNKVNGKIYIGKHYPKLSEAKKGHATWNKGIKVEKFKWLTPQGEIKEMDMSNVKRWHSDWTLLN